MIEPIKFDLQSAQDYAALDDIETWIDAYLRTGDWINLGLADGLKLAPRYWIGPVAVPLTRLTRVCGPEAHMEYRQPLAGWNERVGRISDSFTTLDALPPLIAQFHGDGLFTIRDGNHRHEALKRLGFKQVWVLIWCDSSPDRELVLSMMSSSENRDT